MSENLQQTKNSFKVVGKVSRIDRENAYKEDVMADGHRREGEYYRSLRFGVKTSDNNEITVSTFDYEPKEIFLWNSEKAKVAKEKKQKHKGMRIPFDEWEEKQDELREEGWAVLQARVGFDFGKDGKLITKGLPRYVASQEIHENINNGDSVVVEGNIRYSRYQNAQGVEVEQKNYTIEKVFKLKNDIDFDNEKFEEVSYFEQEMVFVDIDIDKKEGKAYVTGRTIDWLKNFEDTQFVVNFKNEDGTADEDMVKLTKAMKSKFKFGDLISVFGDTVNKVIVEEVEDDQSDEDMILASLGGKSKPSHAEKWTSNTYITEMQILGIEMWDKKVYTEEDFVKDDLVVKEEEDLTESLGGKSKPKENNPFTDDDDDSEEDPFDDLPF